MKRVLITGATGLIGRHCLKHLIDSNYEIHALTSSVSLDSLPDIGAGGVWYSANILDRGRVNEIMHAAQATHLLHLAWYTEHGKYWNSRQNLLFLAASVDLVNAFLQAGGTRIVGAGSCAEYDWQYGVCNEASTPLKPRTIYGGCKNALQIALSTSSANGLCSAAWGRIFWSYGPYEGASRLIPSIINSLNNNAVAKCSHGLQLRDLMFVEDTARAFVALLNSEMQGALNIASGRPVQLRNVILSVGEIMGKQHLIDLGAIPEAVGDPAELVADASLLQHQLGVQPLFDLDKGLKITVDWWIKELGDRL